MRAMRIPLRIVFYKEDDAWVAHCLEFDLAGDGDTTDEAVRRLAEAITLQLQFSLEQNDPKNLFSPAPGEDFEMFAAGRDTSVGEMSIRIDSVSIDEGKARLYSDEPAVPV